MTHALLDLIDTASREFLRRNPIGGPFALKSMSEAAFQAARAEERYGTDAFWLAANNHLAASLMRSL